MRKLYNFILFILFAGLSFQANAQNCNKTCEIQKEVGEGVFLGVQIHSHRSKQGVHVIKVLEGTQAEAMGIQKGDMIYSINGVDMKDHNFMVEWVGNQKAGMAISVDLKRNKERMTIDGELGFKTVKMVTESVCCDEFVGKLPLKQMKMYPNPSSGEFTLSFSTKEDTPMDLKVVDLQGNLIFENTIFPKGGVVNERVLLNAFASGEHMVILNQNGKTMERKIILIK